MNSFVKNADRSSVLSRGDYMHIFYNGTFDFRIVIKVNDFHRACEMLRTYLKDKKKFGVHELGIDDFTHESIDIVLE